METEVTKNETQTGQDAQDVQTEQAVETKAARVFTQEEVNKMMANEKRQGKQAALAELGVKDEQEAKKALEEYRASVNAQKTEEQIASEKLNAAAQAAAEAQRRAEAAEAKVEAMKLNVKPECVDDVVLLAHGRGTDLTTAIAELKTKYPTLFTDSTVEEQLGENAKPTGAKGTGGTIRSEVLKGKKSVTIGERLAASRAPQKTKSTFFNK